MIRVTRGTEPAELSTVRDAKLRDLRSIAATAPPKGTDIDGYRIIAADIWRAQHHKCCYCESSVLLDYNDVEHFRPKAEAERGTHWPVRHGYWWLAFTWDNLLFSCPGCNRGKAKGIQFPLALGSVVLDSALEEQPPGREMPLLIDPALECGVDHIEFKLFANEKQWRPVARNGSEKGDKTISICRLDRDDLREVYTAHVDKNVNPEVDAVREALKTGDKRTLHQALWWVDKRLLRPNQPYVGLSYDALVRRIPNDDLTPFHLAWLRPS